MYILLNVSKTGHFLDPPTQSFADVIYEWSLRYVDKSQKQQTECTELLVCELKGAVNCGVIDAFCMSNYYGKQIVYKTRKSITISCHILVSLKILFVDLIKSNL